MSIRELGAIESKQGNLVPARWNEETGVLELQHYHFPLKGDAHWEWISVGIASTPDAALTTAENYLRGEHGRPSRVCGND
jgi:hypothetical protein